MVLAVAELPWLFTVNLPIGACCWSSARAPCRRR